MTKLEVATALRERTGISQKQAIDAVEIFLESVKEALKTGDKVSLVGFGTFFLKNKGERNGRNPRTGERIRIPAKSIVTFKPGKEFRDAVNEVPAQPQQQSQTHDMPQAD
jgi:DNA-binding protein HU-beta